MLPAASWAHLLLRAGLRPRARLGRPARRKTPFASRRGMGEVRAISRLAVRSSGRAFPNPEAKRA
eukprot:15358586-Alexandrium_andersonii.AAC.1